MGSGPVIIVEPMPEAATVAIGAWLRGGSAQEPAELAGITHVIEHMLLRRTARRGPERIAELIDSLGGAVDAFTTRETCAITAHVPAARHLETLDLMLEAMFEPRFRSADLDVERSVIAAEFDMVQDSPAETVAESALLACWDGHPLARPVLGTREAVKRLGTRELRRYHATRFVRSNLVVVAVGPVDQAVIERRLAGIPRGGDAAVVLPAPGWHTGVLVEERDGLEQVYVNLVLPAVPADHPEVAALGVLQQLLGEGNSSRLFRELRDRLGLVYDIGASAYCAKLAGVLEVTFSCPVRQVEACWTAVLRVLADVGKGRISEREVAVAREALLAGLVLGSEGTDARMDAHAGEHLARGRRFDIAALRRELEAVTRERVYALAREVVDLGALAGAVCGPHEARLLPAEVSRRAA